jgi:hypothetical protein
MEGGPVQALALRTYRQGSGWCGKWEAELPGALGLDHLWACTLSALSHAHQQPHIPAACCHLRLRGSVRLLCTMLLPPSPICGA